MSNPRPHWPGPHNRKGPAQSAMVLLRILLKNPASVPDLRRLTGMPTRRVKQQITWLATGGAIKRLELRDRGMGNGRGGCLAVYAPVVVRI